MKKVLNKKFMIIISIIIIIVTLAAIGFYKFIYPQNCISAINDNYNLQKYDNVIKYKSNLDLIEKYLKNDNEYADIETKVKISEAIVEIDNNNFNIALIVLSSIQEINESNESLNNRINSLLDDIHYNLAIEFLENKNYEKAIEEIEQVKNENYIKLDETKKMYIMNMENNYLVRNYIYKLLIC